MHLRMRSCKKGPGIDHTLSVQEVVKLHIVLPLVLDGSILEDLLVGRRALSQVLLAEGTGMGVEAPGVLEESVYISYLNGVRISIRDGM